VVIGHILPDEASRRNRHRVNEFTASTFIDVAKLALRTAAPETWDHSDDDMNVKARMIPEGVKPKAAAVLVGLVERDGGLQMLLTQRHAGLSKHGGQIAFPGGRIDPGETVMAAALREAEEETGLPPHHVEVVGYLDGYLTVTGYFVAPVVALLRHGFAVAPQPGEVDEVFEVPLSFLLDTANRETHTREWNGLTRRYYAYPYGERYIWGATAGMIKNLGDRLHAAGT
jgi:8-oxo-dGTP pyrophosphatase MutT (NUDIX family)